MLRTWWREVSAIGPHNAAHWPAVRVGIAVTVPMAVLLAADHPEWTGYAVFGSVSAVYSKHRDYGIRLRHQAGAGLALTFAVVLGVLVGIVGPGSLWAVAAMSFLSLLGYLLAQRLGWTPVPSLFLVFAAGAISAYQHTWADVPTAAAISLAAVLFGIVIGQLGRPSARSQQPVPPPAAADEAIRTDAAAYFLGPLIAGAAAVIIGIGHPYWAAVSATVPLVGATLVARLGRASLRFAGTVVGLAVAFLVLTADPPIWMLILLVALFQTITELFVARNYGIAVISLTPLALILNHLGDPSPVSTVVADRFLETLLGLVVAIGLLMALRRSRRLAVSLSGN